MQMIKALMKKTCKYLKENDKADRIKTFQKGATEAVKFIMGKFDEMKIYIGKSE